VLREIVALRAVGRDVRPYAIRRTAPADLLSPVDRSEFARTRSILPARPREIARALTRLLRRPGGAAALAAGARTAWALRPPGARGALWQGFYLAEAVLLWDDADRHGIRHLHAHFANVASDVALLSAELGTALDPDDPWTWSFTMHGASDFWDVRLHRLRQKVASAAFVVCISDFARASVMANSAPEHWDDLHVVRCGVDLAAFTTARAERPADDPLRILNVGRLVPVKGQRMLVELAAGLRDRGIDAEVVIVGEGAERPALEALIREHGLEDRVLLRGALGQDAVPGELARADLFVMPSFAEGLPVSAMEAMAAGVPVVAPRFTGLPELVDDGVTGRLVTPARLDELVEAVAGLAVDPAGRERIAAAARRTVEQRFDVAQEAVRMAALFARYAARG
jgi:glycosyltransferase involved in cell wall biosynthesis